MEVLCPDHELPPACASVTRNRYQKAARASLTTDNAAEDPAATCERSVKCDSGYFEQRYCHAAALAATRRRARSVVLIWSSLLRPERLSRIAPWGRVPRALWISGAQSTPPAH